MIKVSKGQYEFNPSSTVTIYCNQNKGDGASIISYYSPDNGYEFNWIKIATDNDIIIEYSDEEPTNDIL